MVVKALLDTKQYRADLNSTTQSENSGFMFAKKDVDGAGVGAKDIYFCENESAAARYGVELDEKSRPTVISKTLQTEIDRLRGLTNTKRFNELYLPIQWTSDTKNIGVMDADEMWVHPTLQALNAFCGTAGSGCVPVDAGKLADAAIKYLQLPEDQRIKHPLLEKDLASRNRINFKFDLNSIPEGPKRTAITELVKAAALADLYFGLQMDPNYAAQYGDLVDRIVKNPADMMRLKHFAAFGMFKGSECLTVKDEKCSPFAGLDIPTDVNGAHWPKGFTRADIDQLKGEPGGEHSEAKEAAKPVVAYEWKNQAVRRKVILPGSRIIECKKNDPDSFEYKGKWYRPVSINDELRIRIVANMMADALGKASEALKTEDPDLSKLLKMRSDDTRQGPIFASPELDKTWATLKTKEFFTAFGRIESYEEADSHFGVKAAMQAIVGYIDPDLQRVFSGIPTIWPDLDQRIWNLWENKGEKFPFEKRHDTPSLTNIVGLVMNGGAGNSPGYVMGGFNQPNGDGYEVDIPPDQQHHKLVLFGSVCAARVANQGLPVARMIGDEEMVKGLEKVIEEVTPVVIFAQAHEVSHGHTFRSSDEVDVPWLGKKTSLDTVYGEALGNAYEEAKGDMLAMFDIGGYAEKGLITEDQQETAIWGCLGNMLRNFVLGPENTHGRGAVMEFYLMNKHGAIKFDESSGRYHVDMERMKSVAGDMAKEFMDVYFTFDAVRASELDKKAAEFLANSPMGKTVARVKAAGLPGDNLPYYQVENFEW